MTDDKKVRLQSKDLEIAFLSEGLQGVQQMVAGHAKPGNVLRSAVRSLSERGQDVTELQAFVDENHPQSSNAGVRGRRAPQLGEQNRELKVQRSQSGDLFVRVNVTALAVSKGSKVNMCVSDEGLVTLEAMPFEEDAEEV